MDSGIKQLEEPSYLVPLRCRVSEVYICRWQLDAIQIIKLLSMMVKMLFAYRIVLWLSLLLYLRTESKVGDYSIEK